MRLLLVGTPEGRARLRAELDHSSFTVAGEFDTLAEARATGIQADGILISAPVGRASTTRPLSIDESLGSDDYEEPLTAREVEVLELLAEGLPNKSIAIRLGISDQTVKFHVASICGKLGAANRTQAVRRAVRRGLISL
jgi:two-component system, NarL family, nitrate/nitrite response regulator NarL